jgi:hypothetical protein
VSIVDTLYLWTDRVLLYGMLVLRAWALVDCVTRKAAAFPAVDKLTKPAWLGIIVVCILLGLPWIGSPIGIFPLISIVPICVYLADVRPAVREITGGR